MRLTTDDPQTSLEMALNLFYAKDGEAWVRNGEWNKDVTLYDYTKSAISNIFGSKMAILSWEKDEIAEILYDWGYEGNKSIEGIIATLYTAGWAFAEIRARLKQYEDNDRIVRCRDCKHRGTNGCPMHIKGKAADDTLMTAVDDDFCSYGRLK